MYKVILLVIAFFTTVISTTIAGRKAGQGQQDFIPGATLPGATR